MSTARDIPIAVRRADPGAPLPNDYSTTPHGTIFSTTPGGTRIIYDRSKLLSLRNSPLSRTPPANLPNIPGVTRASYSGHPGSLPAHPSSLSRSVSASDVVDTEAAPCLRSRALPTTHEENLHENGRDHDGHEDIEASKSKGDDLFDMEME
ncbi:eukaryotic translation initiation factor 4E binding protein-domain-containing protein [Thamnocephalis sphaerospora]|uniref:Eukaryotic translation initiation factor 4E binding protein-domain-containing protein n=1 Tax=Thamnocephalis sphaerospora TaxID=78915 RepID=A0A4P9XR44_9FUNG|nr:eukaryotic translation initiation factor 4E binding protein-domain-containing protein [Thamnocephalis sphaerospora]|eukprot:RKP08536.1 eukaryotic translation initiation factor 4E binding protein-domain-containing protein [Thamnocephalis sphaerospora]